MRGRRIGLVAAVAGALALAGCERAERFPRAVYVLYDASKTYAPNKAGALAGSQEIAKALRGGDRFAFAKIDSCSFGGENVLVDVDLPGREDFAAQAKLALLDEIDRLKRRLRSETSTDITGALWEFHRQTEAGGYRPRVLVIFSDLEEDLAGTECRGGREAPPDLAGVRVILAGVGELDDDRIDPGLYFARVDAMADRLAAAGADDVVVVSGAATRLRAAVAEALDAARP